MTNGRHRRKLDIDLINKIEAGWTPSGKTLATKSSGKSGPRPSETYRWFRRNELKRKRTNTP